VAEAANEVFDPLFRYFVGTTDLNILGSLQDLISLTGERRIQPLLSALPSLTDEYQRKYALEMLSDPAAVRALTDMLEPAGARPEISVLEEAIRRTALQNVRCRSAAGRTPHKVVWMRD
jgi:hypothetical protein